MFSSIVLTSATLAALAVANPLTSSSSAAPTTCTTTVCADYVNSCGQTYGGCYAACLGYTTPSFSDPGCPSTTSSPVITSTACTLTQCADFINSCGQTYGGCYPACSGYTTPSFSDPGCPTTTTSAPLETSTETCAFVCKDYFDDCGNTFGPGCFTSCPGAAEPTYQTPCCNPSASTTAA